MNEKLKCSIKSSGIVEQIILITLKQNEFIEINN